MRKRGIGPEDIVSVCSTNHLNSILPYVASQFLGCKIANLDPTISPQDITHLLSQVKPKMIFIIPHALKLIEDASKMADINTNIVVFGETKIPKNSSFDEFLKPSEEEATFEPVPAKSLKETAVILFSSGTTGLPKGICCHHYGILAQSYQIQ